MRVHACRRVPLAVLFGFLVAAPSSAQTAAVLKDVNPDPSPQRSFSIANLRAAGSVAYFSGTTDAEGAELWKTDGTTATLVKDIFPGGDGSDPADFVEIAGVVFFTAQDPEGGRELWKTDGTARGTVRVKDIRPGSASSSPRELTAVGSTLFFAAYEPAKGEELWKSDGTEEGTTLVKDIHHGWLSSGIAGAKAFGSFLFFSAWQPRTGCEFWRSDGTADGTVIVADIRPGPGSACAAGFGPKPAVVGNTVYFVATTADAGYELWKTIGSPSETGLVKDIVPGTSSSNPTVLTAVGNTLFFRACDPATGCELWKSDGTAAGTVLVKDIAPGPVSSDIRELSVLGNLVRCGRPMAPARERSWFGRSPPATGFGLRCLSSLHQGTDCCSSGATRPRERSCGAATGRRRARRL